MEKFCKLKDGRQICYEIHGEGKPLLMIAGLAYQLITWHPSMLKAVNDAGYQAIIFDNRDAGRSTLMETKPANKAQLLFQKIPARNYSLEDMASDALELVDHLGFEKVHVLGMSMGGMIAQCFASAYPKRTKSLTSIFSTTGKRNIGQPSWRVKLHVAIPVRQTREGYISATRGLMKIIEGRVHGMDFDWYDEIMGQQWDRQGGQTRNADLRQVGAIMKSGDRSEAVSKITAPTLVLHGDRDGIVNPTGGQATAAAIAGAEFHKIEGMGHCLPESLMPVIMPLISAHLDKAN